MQSGQEKRESGGPLNILTLLFRILSLYVTFTMKLQKHMSHYNDPENWITKLIKNVNLS